jgi:uncharacterized protein (TIGR02246 family)
MKKICLAFVIAISLTTLAFGQRYGQLETDILDAYTDYEKALLKGDLEKLRRIYASEYIFTTSSGDLVEKEEEIQSFSSGKFKIETLRHDYERTRGYGESGIVNLIWIMTGKRDGKPFNSKQRVSIFFVKRENRWQIVAQHSTPIKKLSDLDAFKADLINLENKLFATFH